MNTPETINIEKYAEALNNLIGVDNAYFRGSDKNVDAIVELIVAAKKLENRVKELEADVERVSKQCGEIIVECDERDAERLQQVGEYAAKVKELTEKNKKLIVDRDLHRVSVADTVREIFNDIGFVLDKFYSEANRTKSVTCELMLEAIESELTKIMRRYTEKKV